MRTDLDLHQFHTVQLVPVTPYGDNGQVDPVAARQLYQRLDAAGIRVFIPCAGSAEFHALDPEEILDVVEIARETVGESSLVVAPVGFRAELAVDLGNRAHQRGAAAVLVMPLAFPYLSDPGAEDYYRRLLDEMDCPVMIYKKGPIPSDALLLRLADHPNLIGVKYAVNDLDAFNQIVVNDGGRLDWYCGSAERYAPFFALAGSRGFTSGAGNICPALVLGVQHALQAGDWTEAMRLQRLVLPIENYRDRHDSSFHVSLLKYAVTCTGISCGIPRPPQRQLTSQEQAEIRQLVETVQAAESEYLAAAD